MSDLEQSIAVALNKIAIDAKALGIDVLKKYQMVFVGETFNSINTIQLRSVLETFFSIKISIDELNSLIPSICKTLNMKTSPRKDPLDSTVYNPKIVAYVIHLWE